MSAIGDFSWIIAGILAIVVITFAQRKNNQHSRKDTASLFLIVLPPFALAGPVHTYSAVEVTLLLMVVLGVWSIRR